MTGWRVGWMIGPADVVKAATNLQSHATSNVANVSQAAALAALTGDLSAVATMREAFDRRRQTIVSMLREIPGVACPEPQGAFYVYPSVKGLLGRPIARPDGGDQRRAGRADPGGGRGRRRPGRGLRHAGLRADVLRARRRRPGRGRHAGCSGCSARPSSRSAGPARGTSLLPSACASLEDGDGRRQVGQRGGDVGGGGDRPGVGVDVAADRRVERLRRRPAARAASSAAAPLP